MLFIRQKLSGTPWPVSQFRYGLRIPELYGKNGAPRRDTSLSLWATRRKKEPPSFADASGGNNTRRSIASGSGRAAVPAHWNGIGGQVILTESVNSFIRPSVWMMRRETKWKNPRAHGAGRDLVPWGMDGETGGQYPRGECIPFTQMRMESFIGNKGVYEKMGLPVELRQPEKRAGRSFLLSGHNPRFCLGSQASGGKNHAFLAVGSYCNMAPAILGGVQQAVGTEKKLALCGWTLHGDNHILEKRPEVDPPGEHHLSEM